MARPTITRFLTFITFLTFVTLGLGWGQSTPVTGGGSSLPSGGTDGQCLVRAAGQPSWGSCSGTASSNFSTLAADAPNATAGTFQVGNGTTFTTTGTGAIVANRVFTGAAFAPTADGTAGIDTTTHTFKFGSNGTTKTAAATQSCGANNWLSAIDGLGTAGNCTQPAFSNLSGVIGTAQFPANTGIMRNAAGTESAAEISGDCTTSGSNAITCTKTGGVAFAASATTDTTNAANIGSGTLPAGRLPATAVQTNQSNTYSTGTQDFSAAAHTLPILKGLTASKPATCTVGEEYFATDATAGQNEFYCTATNTWTQEIASGGGSLPSGPTSPNGVAQTLTSTPSGGVAGSATWSLPGVPTNAQTGTTYTIAATDRGSYLTFSNAASIAVTLPQAGTTGFASNFVAVACDIGAGTATVTPTTSTISYTNGSAYTSAATSLALTTGQCAWVYSDNTNYFAIVRTGAGSGTVTTTGTPANGNLAKFSGASSITNGDLSGDVTTSSSLVTTVAKVNGTTVPTNAAADTVLGTTASATGSWLAVPNCGDSSHSLAYSTTTHSFSCQAITGSGGGVADPGANGIMVRTALNTTTARTLTAGSSDVSVTNADGTAGNPTVDIAANVKRRAISFTIGDPGASSALTAATTTTAYVTVPFACTVSAYNLLVDAGTITVKFWKVATGTAIPTSTNSINTSGVSISSGTAIHSTTLTDFTTTSVSQNDIVAMNVTAVATAKYVNGVLECDQ